MIKAIRQRKLSYGGGRVYGITQLNDKIYILREASTVIFVYNAETFAPLKDIRWTETAPAVKQDIVACHKSNCLYITVPDFCEIWRLPARDNCAPELWLKLTYESSVNKEGQVHVLCNHPPRIDTYSSDAGSVKPPRSPKTTYLPADIDNLHHVLETETGNFIVCHGRTSSTSRVFEITEDGQIIWSHSAIDGSGPGELNYPIRADIGPDGCIFVIDFNNGRVLIKDPTQNEKGCQMRTLISNSEDFKPSSLCLVSDINSRKSHLLVGHDGGLVDEYDLEKSNLVR